MKKKLIALFLTILCIISISSCTLGYSTPFDGEPDGVGARLMNSKGECLYEYFPNADGEIPLLLREEDYILEVYLTGGPFGGCSLFDSFVYDAEKIEIIELSDGGVYSLKILEDFEETTIVVSYDSFSCDVLLKMQP